MLATELGFIGGCGAYGQEHLSVLTARPAVTEIINDRLAGLDRERETVPAAGFAPHGQLPGAPVDIAQLKACHFGRAKAEARQQDQDGAITAPPHGRAVTAVQQGAHLRLAHRRGQSRPPPGGNRGHGAAKVASK